MNMVKNLAWTAVRWGFGEWRFIKNNKKTQRTQKDSNGGLSKDPSEHSFLENPKTYESFRWMIWTRDRSASWSRARWRAAPVRCDARRCSADRRWSIWAKSARRSRFARHISADWSCRSTRWSMAGSFSLCSGSRWTRWSSRSDWGRCRTRTHRAVGRWWWWPVWINWKWLGFFDPWLLSGHRRGRLSRMSARRAQSIRFIEPNSTL